MKKKEKKRIKKALLQIVEGKGSSLEVNAIESIEAARVLVEMAKGEAAGNFAVSIDDFIKAITEASAL